MNTESDLGERALTGCTSPATRRGSPHLGSGPIADVSTSRSWTGTRSASPRLLPERGRWAFIGQGSLPDDPVAREHEKSGRRWLILSYAFCPCHIPLTLGVLGGLFGGTAAGAAIAGNGFRVGVVLTSVYAVVLWRGFRQIRRAKRIEAAGRTLDCTQSACSVEFGSGFETRGRVGAILSAWPRRRGGASSVPLVVIPAGDGSHRGRPR